MSSILRLMRRPWLGASPTAAAPAPVRAPRPPSFTRTLRYFHLLLTVLVTGLLAVAFLCNAIPNFGIYFAPPRLPDNWGTVFLLPLVLQIVLAGLSLRNLTEPLWMMVVLVYAVICTGLTVWSVANILISISTWVPTQTGFTALFYGIALYLELIVVLLLTGMEFAIVAVLIPLLGGNRKVVPALARVDAGERTWISLLALLAFVIALFFMMLDVEPSDRVVVDFWPTPLFGSSAATVWLIVQPLLYPLSLALLVIQPGTKAELGLVHAIFGLNVIAGVMAGISLISVVVALATYVPTATPYTAVLAGTVVALIFSILPLAINVIIGVFAWGIRTRIWPNAGTFQRL